MSNCEGATFTRSRHDKQNPYVMISKAMLQDTTISLKAKGLLCYLLTLPDDWKIYHSQLKKTLSIGDEALSSAIEELLEAGYAKRDREKLEGKYQPYNYEFSEFKLFLPDREIQSGFSSPENPAVLKKNVTNRISKEILKETTTAAAVFSCLEKIEMSDCDRTWICEHYDEETVKNAVLWAKHPATKIKSTLAAAIKWACANNPQIPQDEKDKIVQNKKFTNSLKLDIPTCSYVEILPNSVEIGYKTGQTSPTVVPYSEDGFEERVKNSFKKYGIKF